MNSAALSAIDSLPLHDFAASTQYAGKLWKAGEREAAGEAFQRICNAHPNVAASWYNLGKICAAAGYPADALQAIQRALSLAPQHMGALLQLAELHEYLENNELALRSIEIAAQYYPDHPKVLCKYAELLVANDELQKSEIVAQRAIQIDPTNVHYLTPLGNLRMKQERYGEAADIFRSILLQRPNYEPAYYNLGVALIFTGHFKLAAKMLESSLAIVPRNASTACYLAHCYEELRDRDKADYFLKPEHFIDRQQIASFEGMDDREDYHAKLRDHVWNHSTKNWETNTTNNGYHTQDLLKNPDPLMIPFANAIRTAIDSYVEKLKATLDANHPMIQDIPQDYRINLWAIMLQEEGFQSTHNHPDGWISGCYYLSIPDEVASVSSDNSHAGWIEFGEPGYDLPYSFKPDLTAIKPEEGTVVLFPSYYFHHTVPFKSEKMRMSLAFDVIAKKKPGVHYA